MKSKAFGVQLENSQDIDVFQLRKEIIKDSSGKIVKGISFGSTLEQNMAVILITKVGDLKANLDLGVDLRSALLDEDLLEKRHMIKEQFANDGLIVNHLNFYSLSKFEIDAEYQ